MIANTELSRRYRVGARSEFIEMDLIDHNTRKRTKTIDYLKLFKDKTI
eukprot:SAG11_NODE_6336_length_1333_cov_2.346840_1_plen_48_part_00